MAKKVNCQECGAFYSFPGFQDADEHLCPRCEERKKMTEDIKKLEKVIDQKTEALKIAQMSVDHEQNLKHDIQQMYDKRVRDLNAKIEELSTPKDKDKGPIELEVAEYHCKVTEDYLKKILTAIQPIADVVHLKWGRRE